MSESLSCRYEPASEASPAQGLAVLLVGNYPRDEQESMQRFANAMLHGLEKMGVRVELVVPPVCLGRARSSNVAGIGKWLGYFDKFILFPFALRRRVRRMRAQCAAGIRLVVHICDHSNSMYASAVRGAPVVITCHDLLAVRGALGENTDCPASRAGKFLQRWILRSLARAFTVACDSSETKADADRMLPAGVRTSLNLIGLNHPYRPIPPGEADSRLSQITALKQRFILHVGSNLRRKNREGVLRIFAKVAAQWGGQLVFAGDPLSPGLRELAVSFGIAERIVEISKVGNDVLEALYNKAAALLFPSRFEGFGWPIIEAQACGCPVICSRTGPMPEVAGEGAFLRDVEDEDGFAADILRLTEPAERERCAQHGLANAKRFTAERMLTDYLRIYREAAAPR